ncbi:MAG: heavy-metal-associated domain-containing protein [Bacteroidota bacterium]|nr:heavy-metal-associated domain-containing protein [Bacteroidota bacterium]MEC9135005.1 heavy-metal-associated domain-containing protein [Bacteroidota bacterium]
MRQNVKISGMTCQACVTSVTEKLISLDEVQDLKIDLAEGDVVLEVSKTLTLEKLTVVLLPKYIPSLETRSGSNVTMEQSPTKLKQLFPLFLIFVYLIAASIFLQKNSFRITDFMIDFMGLFFVVFSFFKFLDYKGFPNAFARYDPLAKRSAFYAKIYPFIETLLGLMLLLRWQLNFAFITTIVILSITTFGVVYTLFDKNKINCACLGTALKLPMTEATLTENVIMLVMAVTMLFYQFG